MTTSAVAGRSISTPRPSVSPAYLAGRTISRVIIVDDNPEIHSLLKARLEARGFVVRSAEDGEDSLAQFKEFRPDVAFLDVTMPRLGGLDVLQVIRAENLDMAGVLTAAMGLESRGPSTRCGTGPTITCANPSMVPDSRRRSIAASRA